MDTIYSTVETRFWRMLSIEHQHEPISGAGAGKIGGRWNRVGQPALYVSADHSTAIAEFHREMIRPGTLAAYDIHSSAIVDLTSFAIRESLTLSDGDLFAEWRTIVAIDNGIPPGWRLADRLIGDGAHGILVPSALDPKGTNLVLWRWSEDGESGARVRAIDPNGDLRR